MIEKLEDVSFCSDDSVSLTVRGLLIIADTIVTGFSTVILYEAFLPVPSVAFAVITAVPVAAAYTFPAEFTTATLSFEELHAHFLFVASAGFITGLSCIVLPTYIFPFVLLKLIDDTEALTVTLQIAFFPEPSAAIAVIVALPPLTAVTLPDTLTFAILELLLFQITFLLLVVLGPTVAFITADLPFLIVSADLFTLTLVAGCPTVTFTTFLIFAFDLREIVIFALPFFTAFILPAEDTVTIFLLLVENFRLPEVVFVFSVNVFPTLSVRVLLGRFFTVILLTVDVAAAFAGMLTPVNVNANARITAMTAINLFPFFINFLLFYVTLPFNTPYHIL